MDRCQLHAQWQACMLLTPHAAGMYKGRLNPRGDRPIMRAEGRDRAIALEASLFADVEKITRPIVDSAVRLFTRQLDISDEDVRQEARIALLKALRKYDYNASSGGMLM